MISLRRLEFGTQSFICQVSFVPAFGLSISIRIEQLFDCYGFGSFELFPAVNSMNSLMVSDNFINSIFAVALVRLLGSSVTCEY